MLDTTDHPPALPTAPDAPDSKGGGGGEISTGGVGDTLHSNDENFSPNEASSDLVPESLVASDLGLTRQAVGSLRRDHFPSDGPLWKKEGRAILWTREGRAALALLIGAGAPEKKEGRATINLTVVKRVANPRIIVCTNGTRHDLRVRVRDASHLRPSMILTGCVAVDAAHGLYEFQGRMPRRPGRW